VLLTAESAGGLGGALPRVAIALALVSALAAGLLWLLRRPRGDGAGPLRVVASLPLEPRRTIYVVEAAGRFLLVGVGDGPMAVLGEIDAAQARRIEDEGGRRGAGLLELVRRAGRP
jgi:flagellar biogenesis protein FliO